MNTQLIANTEKTVRINLRAANLLLIAYGVSRRRIAEEARVSRPIVTKVLRGRRDVSAEKQRAVLHTIARMCACDVDELVRGRLDRVAA